MQKVLTLKRGRDGKLHRHWLCRSEGYPKRKGNGEFSSAKYHSRRKEALKKLGNKCCKCGFDDYRALHIDHINGGGSKIGKSTGDWSTAIIDILSCNDESYKLKYQLLCANCNCIKRWTNSEGVRYGFMAR